MDISNIEIVVQEKTSSSFWTMVQQAGYAAWTPDRTSEFIWLHPVWYKGERTDVLVTGSGPSKLRQVMNINNNIDSESKLDENKWEKQVMKKQKHKKIIKDLKAALEDVLYCIHPQFRK